MENPNVLKIVAVGGAPGKELLREGLDLTEVEKSPHVLLIPTARPNQAGHDSSMNAYGKYFQSLGLPTEVLHDFGAMPPETEIKEKLEEADMVYISGGDTDKMMSIWREHGIDKLLAARAAGGLVLTGISAGAIAPFAWGHSDSLMFRVPEGEPWNYIPVKTLGFIGAGITPHYDTTPQGYTEPRAKMFHQMFEDEWERQGTPVGFGIDNAAGIVIADGFVTSVSATPGSNVVRLHHQGNALQTDVLTINAGIPLRDAIAA